MVTSKSGGSAKSSAATKKTAKSTTKPTRKATTAKAKPVTDKKSSAAASAVKAAPAPVVVTDTAPVVSTPALGKKELVEAVTERSGVKKRDVKPVVEAMLAIVGQAINEGRNVNLEPLGKAKVNRQKDIQGGKVSIVRVRQADRKLPPKDPLAEAAE